MPPPPYDLENLVNAIANPIFVKDREHRWVLLNDACCELIGVERSKLIGKSDYEFFPKEQADVFWKKDEQVFDTGEENENDEEFTDAAGVTHLINTKKALFTSSTGDKFIVGCITDLTDRYRMQQDLQRASQELERRVQERTVELAAINETLSRQIADHDRVSEQLRQSQKMEAIGQLAGGIAHDFNNLLNVIIGYSSLLERWQSPDRKIHDVAQHIMEAAERAASLTRQLLAFSRKQVLQPEVLEVNELVHSVGDMLGRLIGEDIELEIKTAPDAGFIRVDQGQFEQVIINLAVNARDAMPAGGKLVIETSVNERLPETAKSDGADGHDYVAVKVIDTGKGMRPDVQAHIFEPFFTTKEQGKGTGLGLATVYGIIVQSKGKITVESAPEKGTAFTIFLPKATEEPASVIRQLSVAAPHNGSETVLLVEDQRDLRVLLREILKSHGYTVVDASSGAEALALAQHRNDFDLLITDIVMPGMRGWELAQRLCLIHSQLKVLYISGHTDTDLINDGALLDGAIFLEKPFRPELLLGKVQEMLRSSADRAKAHRAPRSS